MMTPEIISARLKEISDIASAGFKMIAGTLGARDVAQQFLNIEKKLVDLDLEIQETK